MPYSTVTEHFITRMIIFLRLLERSALIKVTPFTKQVTMLIMMLIVNKHILNVILKDPKMTLTTDTLYFNREQQQLFYQDHATIKDETNTLKSKNGNYNLESKNSRLQLE